MNRSELVKAVAERAGGEEAVARRHVDALFEAVMEAVSAGERVVVTGFGAFDRSSRPARSARNPRTGAPVEVPAALVPTFRFGQTFRNRVAQSADAAPAEAVPTEAVSTEAVPADAVPAGGAAARTKKPKKGKKAAAKKTPDKAPEKAPKKGKKAVAADSAPKKKSGKAKARTKSGK
ncbi:Integration host factor subunit beta [Actinomadura sp. RB99]|uniref:HU family DNA-binding protein n=1 Tax=Actinomadura sp. RB99 TaxID=2691577 RepID=UPI0016853771|nr:HU family DNA-binding protein [Actinomadura sp. RB99]MBD2900167.1 Integration host factor subunit beta [Actinomadura sp. RB99]